MQNKPIADKVLVKFCPNNRPCIMDFSAALESHASTAKSPLVSFFHHISPTCVYPPFVDSCLITLYTLPVWLTFLFNVFIHQKFGRKNEHVNTKWSINEKTTTLTSQCVTNFHVFRLLWRLVLIYLLLPVRSPDAVVGRSIYKWSW